MNVSLPQTREELVAGQVSSGEFGNASEVVREALRLLREQQEARAVVDMRPAFAQVDPHGDQGEPSPADRVLIGQLIRRHRKGRSCLSYSTPMSFPKRSSGRAAPRAAR